MSNIKMSNKSMLLVVLILGQLLITMAMAGYSFLANMNSFMITISKEFSFIFFVISFLITIGTLMVFNEIIELSKQQFQAQMAEQKLKDSQNLVQVLRANQHDFMNHLQVIYSAAQLGKIELVDEYFQGIVKDVKEISSISKIVHPEIAALIYSKVSKAEELTAKVNVIISTNLQNIKMTTVDLSRILGNLLDNAIYAISEVEVDDRELVLQVLESETDFKFVVYNRRPVIPNVILNSIFDSGFTTKGNKGSGLGLYNVKQIVDKYHGQVQVVSSVEEGTYFTVTIQKNNN